MTDDKLLGTVLQDRYVIETLIGHGGMGAVYRALQLPIDRPVAIKVIAAGTGHQGDQIVQRFRREASAMAKLRHPNTVQLIEFGVTADNLMFMVMELLDGHDLNHHLSTHGAMPAATALKIVKDSLGSLAEAHARGIVHRDIKPANIFLSHMHDGELLAKVMDFGIAHIAEGPGSSKLTVTGSVMGTPAYMSPEQAMGKPLDARSDLYSLGVTLFHMLTGRTPFEADSMASQLVAHVTQPVPRLTEVSPSRNFRQELQALLDAWLSKDPEQRPRSAKDAARAIDALLLVEPPVASQRGDMSLSASVSPLGAESTPRPVAIPKTVLATQNQLSSAKASPKRRFALPWLLTAAGGLVCLVGSAYWLARERDVVEPHPVRAEVPDTRTEDDTPYRWQAGAMETRIEGATDEPVQAGRDVVVRSQPSAAHVFRDNVEIGKTPFTISVSEPLRVTLKAQDYKPVVLELDADTRDDITAKLERLSAPTPAPTPTPTTAPVPTPTPQPPKLKPKAAVPPAVQKLTAMPREQRKQWMLQNWPPYTNVVALKAGFNAGQLDDALYDDIVWALKTRRRDLINKEKDNYKRGLTTKPEYERRVTFIDRSYEGQ